jgi:transglutaminase-like putative cysteine protease
MNLSTKEDVHVGTLPFVRGSRNNGVQIKLLETASMNGNSSGKIPLATAVQRYFEVALYLLVLTGFGTLAATGGLGSVSVLLVSFALLFRGYLLATRRTLLIPERWTTVLTLSYAGFYLADYFLISGAFLGATVHLVLFVMVVRLFSAQRDRDHYFLSVIAFLMVLAAAVLTVNSIFLLAFAGFMLMAVATFILMEMRRASAKATIAAKDSTDNRAYRKMAFALAAVAPGIALCVLLVSSGIFFLLPRVSAGYLNAYTPGSDLSTGFADRVELGRIGQIQQSNALVMHIQIDGDPHGAFDLKWRGVALNLFDGRTWSNPRQLYLPRMQDGSFVLTQLVPRSEVLRTPPPRRPIHYKVLMEPMGSNVFFLAATANTLAGNYRRVAMDDGGAVFDLDPDRPVGSYEASSNLAQPEAKQLRAAVVSLSPEVQSNYLQLPPLDPRIPRLAEQITAQADNNYDRAEAIERYLQTHYGYTLQLSSTVPSDPLAEFLFERKRGHCEYFASSMAIMLRTLRIPSRVVNGFRTGEFNDLTSQYLIRASDAHSWVEAYFPGYGWVNFDPTPAGPSEASTGWRRFRLYTDAMASFWREWVINYDMSHQQHLAFSSTRSGRELLERVQAWARRKYQALLSDAHRTEDAVGRAPTRWSVIGTLAAILLLLGANATRLWRVLRRFRLAARPGESPQLAATIWYERMTRRVARQGWRKSPVQTPEEFVISIDDAVIRKRVEEFTRRYESARFGESAEDAERLPKLYEEISGHSRG